MAGLPSDPVHVDRLLLCSEKIQDPGGSSELQLGIQFPTLKRSPAP